MPPSVGLNTQLYRRSPIPNCPANDQFCLPPPPPYLLLQARVSYLRIFGKTLMGTLLPENRSEHKISDHDDPDPLYLAVRAQQNFAENVFPH